MRLRKRIELLEREHLAVLSPQRLLESVCATLRGESSEDGPAQDAAHAIIHTLRETKVFQDRADFDFIVRLHCQLRFTTMIEWSQEAAQGPRPDWYLNDEAPPAREPLPFETPDWVVFKTAESGAEWGC